MRKLRFFITLFLGLSLIINSCKNDKAGQNTETVLVRQDVDLEPEEMIKLYQSYIDSNRFEEAKQLSTTAGRNWIDKLAILINSMEQIDSTMLQTSFKSILCSEKNDTAYCNCLLVDRDGEYDQFYQLVKVEGYWKVDAPEEDPLFIDDEAIQEQIKQWQD